LPGNLTGHSSLASNHKSAASNPATCLGAAPYILYAFTSSDILVFASKSKYSGLALELKVGYNKPTENQFNCLERLKNASWDAHWCNSFDAAKEIIDNFMSYE